MNLGPNNSTYFWVILWMLSFGSCNSQALSRQSEMASSGEPSLLGEWVVTETTKSPLSMVLLCKPVRKGTIFKLTHNTLEVYIDAAESPCDVYFYKATNKTISFIKEDMVFFCNYDLNASDLKLTSNSFFTPLESDTSGQTDDSPTTATEIAVHLKKMK